jgi:hypothetical protein
MRNINKISEYAYYNAKDDKFLCTVCRVQLDGSEAELYENYLNKGQFTRAWNVPCGCCGHWNLLLNWEVNQAGMIRVIYQMDQKEKAAIAARKAEQDRIEADRDANMRASMLVTRQTGFWGDVNKLFSEVV